MMKSNSVLDAYLGISSKTPEEAVLRLLIEMGAQFVGAEEGSLLVFDERKKDLVFAMTIGSDESERTLIGQRVPIGRGITGLAAQTREVQIGAPTFGTRQAKRRDGRSEAPKSVLAAPMLIGDRLVGVLTAVSVRAGKLFNSNDALLYARVAAVAGVVVEQSRRLAAVEAARTDARRLRAVSEQERCEQQLLDAVARIVQSRPRAKAQIVRLLSDIAGLVAE
ncbi:MAG: GAF domain-containing protein [Verrucomicrobia bacterium]|nr:GAF domain-containing protein [Verrucomicrobiota bacterium]